MVALDCKLGSDDFKRAQDCGAHNNHDEVQSEAQGSEALWKVSPRAITREEEMAEGPKSQNAICDSNKLGREKARSKVK